jgi:hypothetical protein
MEHSNGTAAAPRPYRPGWRAPWRGQWGTFADGHSKISFLARKIEREELSPAYPAATPLAKRRRQAAARFLALVVKAMGEGNERKVCVMQKQAEAQLGKLQRMGEVAHTPESLDLARALQAVQTVRRNGEGRS